MEVIKVETTSILAVSGGDPEFSGPQSEEWGYGGSEDWGYDS